MIFLIFLFTVVPVTELMLLFKAGAAIGGFNTVAIVILTGVVGASLAKSQGLSLLQQIQVQMQKGQLPAEQLLQGFLILAGGLLLMTPGFITDFLGFAMVFPVTRLIFVKFLKVYFEQKIKSGQFHVFRGGFSASTSRTSQEDFYRDVSPQKPKDIRQGRVIDVKDISEDEN